MLSSREFHVHGLCVCVYVWLIENSNSKEKESIPTEIGTNFMIVQGEGNRFP